MNLAAKVSDHDELVRAATKMPAFEDWEVSMYMSTADKCGRTGEEMLATTPETPSKQGSVTYPLWNYLSGGVPMAVRVRLEDNVWLASIDSLDLNGDGDTPREALNALEEHLDNYIDFYGVQNVSDLTDYAKKQRRKFLDIVQRD